MERILGWSEILDYDLYIRGVIITVYAIILFRAHSARLFGNHSPLDFIIYVILGAILGEAIVNNIPLLPSMIVSLMILIIHRILAFITYKNHRLGQYIKGEKICLIKNGKYCQNNMSHCRITPRDVEQALRLQHGLEQINDVKTATLERSGQISFILRGNS